MHNRGSRTALLLVAGLAVLGLLALVWAMGAGSSEASPDAMQNCPQANKWAISVWDGANGTDTGQALATCGAGAVAAAYHLDPQTNGWLRWFDGRPEISNLATVDDMQGIIALGSTSGPAVTPTATATAAATPTPPPAGPVAGATYTGITSQGKTMQFTVASDGAHVPQWEVEFLWQAPCQLADYVGGGTELGDTWGIQYPVGLSIANNEFSEFHQGEFPTSSLNFWGVFSTSNTAEGTARFTEEGVPGSPCDSGVIEWNATAQGP